MGPLDVLFKLLNGYKTYSAVIAMIVSGILAIYAKDYSTALAQILQAIQVISMGGAVASLRHAVSKPPGDPAK